MKNKSAAAPAGGPAAPAEPGRHRRRATRGPVPRRAKGAASAARPRGRPRKDSGGDSRAALLAAAASPGEAPQPPAGAAAGEGQRQGNGAPVAAPGEVIERVVAAYMRVLAANPWIPGLIVREVLTGSGSYRSQFVRDFPSQIAPLAIDAIRRASAAGRFRADLDPRLALVSCIGMAVMPFIGAPVLAKLFGDDFGRDPERLIAHTLDLLRHGLRVAHS